MTVLEGDAALALHDAISAEEDAKRAARFAVAKARAATRGKEPFDLDRFEEMYTIGKETGGSREERLATREYEYYVEFEDTITMEEFAKRVWEVRDFWDGRR